MARPPGSAIGRYQIVAFIARGETSIVYEAREPDSGQTVALKILPPSAMRDPARADDFLRLAGRLAVLHHPNLLPILDYGREDGLPFVASPIAQGGILQDNLDAYRRPALALALVADLARAVDYLHRHDLVHGRIEPRHILLDADGRPLLTGVGRPYSPAGPGTAPAYLAPEQRQDQAPDERTDIYQLACLLHHLLLGRPPDPTEEWPASIETAGLDDEITAILAQALATQPADRFASAAELAERLAAAGQQLPAPVSRLAAVPLPVLISETPAVDAPAEPPKPAQLEGLIRSMPGPLRDKHPLWLAAAFAGLALLLALFCLLVTLGASTIRDRLRQPLATAQVNTNVRAGPGIEYPIVGLLRAGQQAAVHGVSPDGRWWQITFVDGPGDRGWVPAAFVTVEESGNVDVVQPPPLGPRSALPRPPGEPAFDRPT